MHTIRFAVAIACVVGTLIAVPGGAILPPESQAPTVTLGQAHADISYRAVFEPLTLLPEGLRPALAAELSALGLAADQGFYDRRGGRWGTLVLRRPLLPGSGRGNDLTWASLGEAGAPADREAYGQIAERALRDYLDRHRHTLRIDPAEVRFKVTVHEGEGLVQFFGRRVVGGITVRQAHVTAVVKHGNLILLGTRNWGDVDPSLATSPTLDAAAALARVEAHVGTHALDGDWRPPALRLVPTARGKHDDAGGAYQHRLAWLLSPKIAGDAGHWEALVDAHSGELIVFGDTNHYFDAAVSGGVYPLSNDAVDGPLGEPEGTEQAGWPMPFATLHQPYGTSVESNSAGLVEDVGQVLRSDLSGPYVRIHDNCGPIDEAMSCGNLDFGAGPGVDFLGGTDCDVPFPGASPGNTKAARTGFYEVNRIVEQARGWLPANPWIRQPVLANMNIMEACNAFWGGSSINFYQQSAGCGPPPPAGSGNCCANTGEIAAVFDHEWGHGMDDNDAAPDVSFPGEAPADIYSLVRLNDSCVGRGFFINNTRSGLCTMGGGTGGAGDICTECTGVREVDFFKRQSAMPHDIAWILRSTSTVGVACVLPPGGCVGAGVPIPTISSGPCNLGTHCEGSVVSEVIWDLIRRDLPCHPLAWEYTCGSPGPFEAGQCAGGAAPAIDVSTTLNMVARMHYLGGGNVISWYQCDTVTGDLGGCNADGGYFNFLAVDDDDGDLTNGTPHMTAIHAAFERHQMACNPPDPSALTVQDSGCAGGPATAPTLSAVALNNGAFLDWGAVAGATEYWVYRTDGIHGCEFGKERLAITTDTDFTDTGLLAGRDYFYTVEAVGASASCRSLASPCQTVVPTQAPVDVEPLIGFRQVGDELSILTGDGDDFLDNCELSRFNFEVENAGLLDLTDVQLVRFDTISPGPGVLNVLTPLPLALADVLPANCGSPDSVVPARVEFVPTGLAFDDLLEIEFEVQATVAGAPREGGNLVSAVGTFLVPSTESNFGLVSSLVFDFEAGLDSWTVIDGVYTREVAPVVNPPLPPAGAPPSVGAFMASSRVQAGACDRIRSPEFQVTATSGLSLWNQYDQEVGQDPALAYDRANVGLVDVLTDELDVISPSLGRLYNASLTGGGCAEGRPGWTGSGPGWLLSEWDSAAMNVGDHMGRRLRLQVLHGTDPLLEGIQGFLFDHVELTDVLAQVPDEQADSCVPVDLPACLVPLGGDGFESGDTVAWTRTKNPQGQLLIQGLDSDPSNPDAALDGAFGMAVTIDDNRIHRVERDLAGPGDGVSSYCFSFLFDPNDVDPGSRRFKIWTARDQGNKNLANLDLMPALARGGGTEYGLQFRTRRFDGKFAKHSPILVDGAAPVLIGVEWTESDGGSSNGSFRLFVDGVERVTRTGIPNGGRSLRKVGLGFGGAYRRTHSVNGTPYWDAYSDATGLE